MDYTRLLACIILAGVSLAYLVTTIQILVMLYRHRGGRTEFVHNLNFGRAFSCAGVVILAGAVLQGYIDNWGLEVTPRVPFGIVAAVVLGIGWFRSVRYVFREDATPAKPTDILNGP